MMPLRIVALLLCLSAAPATLRADPPLDSMIQTATTGNRAAQVELAQRYLNGTGVLQDYKSAITWFTRAAENGDASAQNTLGQLYYEGLGVAQNGQAALGWLEQAAQSGVPDHIYDLATVLETDPERRDIARALALYTKAADAGHIPATVSLGVLYQNGTGTPRDFAVAKRLYEIGAAAGNARALNNLALLYVRGDGVAQDYERAAALLTQAAEMGLRPAIRNLGVLYENGYGVPMDVAKADELYRVAGTGEVAQTAGATFIYDPRLTAPVLTTEGIATLEQGVAAYDPVALFQSGWLLATQAQADVAQWQQARQLFEEAAKRGHGPAMANLALMYFKGIGAPQDYMLGHMWLLLATHAGAQVQPLTAEFGGKATAGQINEAQRLALRITTAEKSNNLPND